MELMTTAQVATELEVDRSTVIRWVKSGKLQPVQTLPTAKGSHLFDPADISALIDEAHS